MNADQYRKAARNMARVHLNRDPFLNRRPSGLLYAFPAPPLRRRTRAQYEADQWARRAIREDASGFVCDCCRRRPAVVKDMREVCGTLGRWLVCEDCYSLSDPAFRARLAYYDRHPAAVAEAARPYAAGLPARAYLVHPTDPALIVMVIPGERGYFPIVAARSSNPQAVADDLNGGPLAPDVAEAMLAGSMFGWDVPGADPRTYSKKKA